ncbi:MAG: glycosyltransferase family 2 protein [Ekhidna sp.]|uniref:glycosyltransferase family 2 protein n=1 Tax=Ekhidna sp. TaxID=2608089 RepID=UPI0032EE3B2A
MKISIVLPVYNNERDIRGVCLDLFETFRDYDLEVICVNDASPDDCASILEELSRSKLVHLIDLKENVGQQKATLKGLKKASGQFIGVMDADGQDDPVYFLEMIDKLINGDAEAVFVKRVGQYQSLNRMITSRGIKLLVQVITGLDRRAGSYYLMKKTTLQRVLKVSEVIPTPYMSIIVGSCARGVGYVEGNRNKSISTSYNSRMRLKAAFDALSCSIRCRLFLNKI